MRIVIEIEGDKVISATVEGSASAGGPPPEVLEAARARGAISAGRAPLNSVGAGAHALVAPEAAGAARTAAGAAAPNRKRARASVGRATPKTRRPRR